jgi:hypothetical protein|tara:strand:+ start:145 stop:384 length:240 start_codon:yes stop_codon:yes gene_type:complete
MTTKYDGGPAFPYPVHNDEGMSLRDYFAGQAIVGAASDSENVINSFSAKYIVKFAYEIADQMLAQRDFVAPIAKEGDDE